MLTAYPVFFPTVKAKSQMETPLAFWINSKVGMPNTISVMGNNKQANQAPLLMVCPPALIPYAKVIITRDNTTNKNNCPLPIFEV